LVADYLGLLDTLSTLTWWHFKDSVDRLGPVLSSKKFNAGDDLVNRNPVEDWLVDRFAADPQGTLPLLKSFGANIIDYAHRLKTQIDYWNNSRRLNIEGIPAMIGDTRESLGLEEYRRLEPECPDIVISLDRRTQGWRLYRYDGTPVDFSRLAGRKEIAFAHKSGFMAVTREKLPEKELVVLVSEAIIK
jgi:hypothetical protein